MSFLVIVAGLVFSSFPVSGDHIDMSGVRTVLRRDAIPSIDEPRFDAGQWIGDGERVIGVARFGEAKAYPIKVLDWHEIVNDHIGPTPVAVTYCPLCGSAIVYERTLPTGVTTFGVSGMLYQQDLVMFDRETESLWPQILGVAVNGRMRGTELSVVPSSVTTWAEWKQAHPGSLLLSPPQEPGLRRDYDRYPYGNYESNRDIGISRETRDDVYSLHPKAYILGLGRGDEAVAYPYSEMLGEGWTLDEVDGESILVVTALEDLFAYFEDGRGLRFEDGAIRDRRGNAYHASTGVHAEGPDRGDHLRPVDAFKGFWFAWFDFHRDTRVWGVLGVTDVRVEPLRPGGAEQVVRLEFTQAVDRRSVEQAVSIRPPVNVSYVWKDERTLLLTAQQPLPHGTYALGLDDSARDAEGNSLASPYEKTFAVGEVESIKGVGLVGLGLIGGAFAAGLLAYRWRRRR